MAQGSGPQPGASHLVRARSGQMEAVRRRYWKELQDNRDAVELILHKERVSTTSPLYMAHDQDHNGALASRNICNDLAARRLETLGFSRISVNCPIAKPR